MVHSRWPSIRFSRPVKQLERRMTIGQSHGVVTSNRSGQSGIHDAGSNTCVFRPTVAKQSSEFYRRRGEKERLIVAGHPMGSRVVPTTATPDPWCFNINEGKGRSTVRSQAIAVRAGRQIRQASKQTITNE